MTCSYLVCVIWGVFFLFWAVSALHNAPQIEHRESFSSRMLYLGLIGVAICLIAFDPLIHGPLLWRFLPRSAVSNLMGLVVLLSGPGFAV
jgi:hypothetical protein